jgi:hypothetical protein
MIFQTSFMFHDQTALDLEHGADPQHPLASERLARYY